MRALIATLVLLVLAVPVAAAAPATNGPVRGATLLTEQPATALAGGYSNLGPYAGAQLQLPDRTYPAGYSPTGNLRQAVAVFDRPLHTNRQVAVRVLVRNVGTAQLGGPNVCVWLAWRDRNLRASWGCPEVVAAPGDAWEVTLVTHPSEFLARYGPVYRTGTQLDLHVGRYKEAWRGEVPADASWQVHVLDVTELPRRDNL